MVCKKPIKCYLYKNNHSAYYFNCAGLMTQAIQNFFDSENFMPHGHCFLWQPDILWLHVISDAVIATAYYAIPFVLLYIVYKRKDLPFESIFLLFGAFILLCGLTHAMSIWVLWRPDYALEGVLKALTALASIATFFVTVKLIPRILRLPSTGQLAALNAELQSANERLETLYAHSRESGQAHLRAVVDNALDGLISINEAGIIESFNPACERIFGYMAAEVIGQNIKMLMPEPYHSEHDGYLAHHNNTGEAKIIGTAGREVQAKRKDGSVFPMDLSISAFDLGGRKFFSGIVRDITARKESEKLAARMAAIVLSSSDAILSKTLEGIITSWNPGAEILFGHSASEIIGKHISSIIPIERMEEEIFIMNEVRQGRRVDNYETVRVAKGGRLIDVSSCISPIHDKSGKIIGASKIIRDISPRKAAEAMRDQLIEKLSYSNSQLESFAYVCSHDLQEPLRMISNFTQMLEKHLGDTLDEKGRKYMRYVVDGALRARQLIVDVLSLARISSEDKAMEAVDCNEVLASVISVMQERIRETGATVTHDALPKVMGHRIYVMQVLQNLIGNALKFQSSQPPVIHVSAKRVKDFWQLSVRDNGIGIEPEYQDKIFQVFQRLHSKEAYPGNGIGLAIVRKIIERHGGKIWMESQYLPDTPTGTTFYFTLPVADTP